MAAMKPKAKVSRGAAKAKPKPKPTPTKTLSKNDQAVAMNKLMQQLAKQNKLGKGIR